MAGDCYVPEEKPTNEATAVLLAQGHLSVEQQNNQTLNQTSLLSLRGPHADSIASYLYQTWHSRSLCDFKVVSNDKCFEIHKVILAANSKTFSQKLQANPMLDHVTVSGVKEEALQAIVKYLYTGKLVIQEGCGFSKEDIRRCGVQLSLDNFLDGSSAALEEPKKRPEEIRVGNAVDIFHKAKRQKNLQEYRSAVEFISRNMDDVCRSQGFLQLPLDDLIMLLKEDQLHKISELPVFHAAVKWLDFDRSKRSRIAAHVLTCVRFRMMTPSQLASEVENNDFMSTTPCHKFVYDAFRFHALARSEMSLTSLESSSKKTSVAQTSSSLNQILPAPQHVHRPRGSSSTMTRPDAADISVSSYSMIASQCLEDMKKFRLLAICGSRIYTLNKAEAKYNWEELVKLPEYRNYPAVAYLDGCLFVIGGMDAVTKLATNKVIKYRLEAGAWEEGSPLQEARDYAAAAVLGDTIYVVGGIGNSFSLQPLRMLNSMEVFTTHRNFWNYAAPASASCIGSTLVPYRGLLYRIGGFDGLMTMQHLEVYDPQYDRWYLKKPMVKSIGYASGATACGRLYLLGGAEIKQRHSRLHVNHLTEVYQYNGITWDRVGNIHHPRYNAGVVAFGNTLIITGGQEAPDNRPLSSVECFDPTSQSCVASIIPDMPRGGAVICCLVPKHF